MNEKLIRLFIIIFVCALHLVLVSFLVFETKKTVYEPEETAKVMKVTDISEYTPPPIIDIPIPVMPLQTMTFSEIPQTTGIAEYMIETEEPITYELTVSLPYSPPPREEVEEDYREIYKVSKSPVFNEAAFIADVVYPPIALRSGVEGRVVLELFVDRYGVIKNVSILLEEPSGRGFGEAAAKAFIGKRGEPAYANDEPVSCRYRYPFRFVLR